MRIAVIGGAVRAPLIIEALGLEHEIVIVPEEKACKFAGIDFDVAFAEEAERLVQSRVDQLKREQVDRNAAEHGKWLNSLRRRAGGY